MYRIGIDLGGTNIVVGLVEQDFRIVDKCSVKTQVPRSVESMTADMAQMGLGAMAVGFGSSWYSLCFSAGVIMAGEDLEEITVVVT